MLKIIAGLLIFLLSGCASTSKGFWSDLRATKADTTFYIGKYVGRQQDCFPPIDKRQCLPLKDESAPYEAEQKINMEEFSFSLSSVDFFEGKRIGDLLYLAASNVAIERGFSMFTVIRKIDVTLCRDGVEARTTGSLDSIGNQATYSGTTTVRSTGQCRFSQSITVLMFNDKSLLAKGILKKSNSGNAQWLYPETSLYLGSIPNLNRKDFNYTPDSTTIVQTPENAWKIHYEARLLSSDLRAKYKITDSSTIEFKDELSSKLKSDANDPILQRRVVSP